MKVAQILLLVAATALLKVNSSWGQDVVATTAAGIDTAPDAGVPTKAAVVPLMKKDSPKATEVIHEKDYPDYGGGGNRCQYGLAGKKHETTDHTEMYLSVTGTCQRSDYNALGCFTGYSSCGLSTGGGIIAILLGILLLRLIAAVAVGVFLLKKGNLPQLMPLGGAGGTTA